MKTKEANTGNNTALIGLDYIEGKYRFQNAPSLIDQIEQICGCFIQQSKPITFNIVDDIDEHVGVEDLNE
jgi:hypothetical protein